MATIYISYSNKDKDLVNIYVALLQQAGHEILMDSTVLTAGSNLQQALLNAMKRADGMIVFLTKNGIGSKHVNSEIGIARSYLDTNNKFLIPLVEGDVSVPYVIQDLMYLKLESNQPQGIVATINDIITKRNSEPSGAKSNRKRTAINNINGKLFAASLYEFLVSQEKNTVMGKWIFDGKTDTAFSTPGGAWDAPGFLFITGEYSFVMRSVPESGYLVIESNNLEGQLVNHNLNTSDKFSRDSKGIVTISEAFDMTVGAGRRSRAEVEATYKSIGWQQNIVSRFDETRIDWIKIIEDVLEWAIARERVKEIIQDSIERGTSIIPEAQHNSTINNFWFLKIFGDNWYLDNIKEGAEGHFNSFLRPGEKRPEYDLFELMKPGDRGYGYDISSKKGLVFLFNVTQPLHNDSTRQEVISFQFTKIILPPFSLESLNSILLLDFDIDANTDIKLYPLSGMEYSNILEAIRPLYSEKNKALSLTRKISLVAADSATGEIRDELGFESDVDALASVIAYREVKPPLAIGLFGNWGSGKSFFMNKMQAKIKELAERTDEPFCKEVVQINFNSWHYSDSNLWASLITKIFDALQKFKQSDPDKIDALFSNLNSTKALLADKVQEKKIVQDEIEALTTRQKALDTEIKQHTEHLNSLTPDEIAAGVLKDTYVVGGLQELTNKYQFLDVKEYREIKESIRELQSGMGKFIATAKLTYSFRKGRLWIALGFAIFAFAVIYYVLTQVDGIKEQVERYKQLLAIAAVFLSQIVANTRVFFTNIRKVYNRLVSLKDTCDNLIAREREKINAEQEALKSKLEGARNAQLEIRAEIEQLTTKKNHLEAVITDIASGKKITRFIEGRVADERYINSLGIISWIRKDFEELDYLLKQQYEAVKSAKLSQLKIDNVFEVERIILYIDDLDRCDVDIVVRVLEAINLLLAFPLFVVVVGVDPRWMNKALSKKYADLLSSDKDEKEKELSYRELGQPATSYDYLEKIFQIPFVLKPLDKKGKDNLIRSQLEHIAVEPPQNNPIHPAPVTVSDEVAIEQALSFAETETHIIVDVPAPQKNIPAVISPERLQVSDDEIQFMQAIDFLIGESPRTIKRYINIYRIIRTHSSFNFPEAEATEHYYAAMVLLAVITGEAESAPHFFSSLQAFDTKKTFYDFVSNFNGHVEKEVDGFFYLEQFIATDMGKRIKNIPIEKFIAHIGLISRFSFRSLKG